MAVRIEIYSKVPDTRAGARKKKLEQAGFAGIKEIWIVDVYTIDKPFTLHQLSRIASMIANPVTQSTFITSDQKKNPLTPGKFSWAIETGFLPGVTDNIGNTAKEMIADLLKVAFRNAESVYASQLMFVQSDISRQDAQKIAESLVNPLIQRIHVKSFAEYKKDGGMDLAVPKVTLLTKPGVQMANLEVSDDELITIGKEGIPDASGKRRGPLALDVTYMKAIQRYFKKEGRHPTDVEIESIAQTWSEHCKHTIFADPIDEIKDGLYKQYIQKATFEIRKAHSAKASRAKKDICVSVFADNSGAIEFDDQYLITDKVETHNSPSALDPFGGAITGICGVNRDALGFGLGAKPVANRFGFCFADPESETQLFRVRNKTQKMLPPRRIMDGVIEGVNSGGNCSGIPTLDGFLYFDPRYIGKPLVFVGTIGLIPKKVSGKPSYTKRAMPGDYIVMIGGRVGLDGIHGATFSSEAMDSGSPVAAVQIGDPITQKKLSDALAKEARDLGLYSSITDNGAGGLSCSVAEMAKESGGCEAQLEKVPLKYPGLDPWQIWISESQERMTLAVPKKKWKSFSELMKRREVEATAIGIFTDSGRCLVKYNGKTVMNVAMAFLHNGLPKRPMKTIFKKPFHPEPNFPQPKDLTTSFASIFSRPNIAGFSFISQQFDHTVQGGAVLGPLAGRGRVNADATVFRPVLNSARGVVLSHGICPNYSDIDTKHMAACAIDSAIRSAISAGADPEKIALLDNFCWCSATDPKRLGELKRAAKACYEYAVSFGTPFIAGKDSMFNDFKGYDTDGNPVKISIPPTLLISTISVIPDVSKAVSIDAKIPGDLMYLLGETFDELGASEYFAIQGSIGNRVPQVDAKINLGMYSSLHACIDQGLVASAISVSRGGLAVAIGKMLISGMLGAEISLKELPGKTTRDDFALFSESQGRILVTVAPQNNEAFEKIMKKSACKLLGKVSSDGSVKIKGRFGKTIVDTDVNTLWSTYHKTFKGF